MATYRVMFTTNASVTVTVEADDEDAALDAACEKIPSGVCERSLQGPHPDPAARAPRPDRRAPGRRGCPRRGPVHGHRWGHPVTGDPGQTHSGVPCSGQDGQCGETFTITETTAAAGATDPSTFDCGGRCEQ